MKNENKYDERQIVEQMKAYRRGFIVAMLLISLVYVLKNEFGLEIDVDSAIRICFWIPITVVIVLVIANDACVVNGWWTCMLHIYGFLGAIVVVQSIHSICHSENLQEEISWLIKGLCFAVADVVNIIKRRRNEKFKDEFTESGN